MSWWMVLVLAPLSVMAVLGVGVVIGIAVDTSADDAGRRLPSWPIVSPRDAREDDVEEIASPRLSAQP